MPSEYEEKMAALQVQRRKRGAIRKLMIEYGKIAPDAAYDDPKLEQALQPKGVEESPDLWQEREV